MPIDFFVPLVQAVIELGIMGVTWGLSRDVLSTLTQEQQEALLGGLLFAARYDGHEAPEEAKTISALAQKMLGDDAEKSVAMLERARAKVRTLNGANDEEHFVRLVAAHFPKEEQRKALLRAVAYVALSSPQAAPRQREVIDLFAHFLGFGADDTNEAVSYAEAEVKAATKR